MSLLAGTAGATFTADFDLTNMNGSNGFVLRGVDSNDYSGTAVANAGDINGDGIDDLLVGANGTAQNGVDTGSAYVIFGDTNGFNQTMRLSDLDGKNGFVLNGENGGDFAGQSVAAAGDVNGDGFDDIIIGAWGSDANGFDSGRSYVVYGKNTGFAPTMNLGDLTGVDGFIINGTTESDFSGVSVKGAGDVNADGISDIIIGADGADPNGANSGTSYVVFGNASGFNSPLTLSEIDGTNGFRLHGELLDDGAGWSVSAAGDLNNDGISDVIVGAHKADPNGPESGKSYVVFGNDTGFPTSIELGDLDGTNGFVINGENSDDRMGYSASQAGDINGDGIDDIIVGAYGSDINGGNSGKTYVVFGQDTEVFPNPVNLTTLNGEQGFEIQGVNAGDLVGISVSAAGDVNGDGVDDLIIGSAGAEPLLAGKGYVLYGIKTRVFPNPIDLDNLNGFNGFVIHPENESDLLGVSVSAAGDINGDGLDDVVIGASNSDTPGTEDAGSSYVIFGDDAIFTDDIETD